MSDQAAPVINIAPDIQALMEHNSNEVVIPAQAGQPDITLRAPTLDAVGKQVIPHLARKTADAPKESGGEMLFRGLSVRVNCIQVCLPGLSDSHAMRIAQVTAESGHPLFDECWKLCGLPDRRELGDTEAADDGTGEGEEAPLPVRPLK